MSFSRPGKMAGCARWFAARSSRIQIVCAALLGALGGLGQAPYGAALVLVLCCAAAFAMCRAARTPWRAAQVGWAFATGYFLHTLFWIVEPFQVDALVYGWMAPFALVLMASGLALFWGLAFWLARVVSPHSWPLILTWTAVEVLRAYVLTGFPWGGISQIVVDGAAVRGLAFAGPHGVTLGLLCAAWSLSLPAPIFRRTLVLRAAQVAVLLGAAVALHVPLMPAPSAFTDRTVRLIQPNAPQHLKWQPEMVEIFFNRQLALTAQPPAPGQPAPDLVVWPETAVTWLLDTADPTLREIAAAAGGVPVALGLLRLQDEGLRNALVLLDAAGSVAAIYDKHHLVPFGEYLPLAPLAARLGLRGLAESRGPGFTPGPGPAVLDFGAAGTGMPLICYEAVFAHLVGAAPQRPAFLVQITNDAWFGNRAGPQQHLAQARMRAAEQGLPLMRAANTGISAMIDPYGRITAALQPGVAGALDARLPQPLAPTLYSRTGDLPLLLLVIFASAIVLFRRNVVKNQG